MHQRVRKEFWGFQPDEQMDNEALIGEKYRGIRPAPGYPACPEHTEKATHVGVDGRPGADRHLATVVDGDVCPVLRSAAGTSRTRRSRPEYFVVGRVAQDRSPTTRSARAWTLKEAERWLAPNLGYNPED